MLALNVRKSPLGGWGLKTYISLFLFCIAYSFQSNQSPLQGAWISSIGSTDNVLNIQDGYLSHTTYDKTRKHFYQTRGGSFEIKDNKVVVHYEFSSSDKNEVGKSFEYVYHFKNGNLIWENNDTRVTWQRIDDNKNPLAGVWRISGRMQEGKMNPINPGPRKTLKILSGTCFQWVAINTETKEFFGTGGGRFSFVNGKYTENIEFFSRDSSRVGVSLTFDGSIDNNIWTHKGLNSRGEPLHEEWSRN